MTKAKPVSKPAPKPVPQPLPQSGGSFTLEKGALKPVTPPSPPTEEAATDTPEKDA